LPSRGTASRGLRRISTGLIRLLGWCVRISSCLSIPGRMRMIRLLGALMRRYTHMEAQRLMSERFENEDEAEVKLSRMGARSSCKYSILICDNATSWLVETRVKDPSFIDTSDSIPFPPPDSVVFSISIHPEVAT